MKHPTPDDLLIRMSSVSEIFSMSKVDKTFENYTLDNLGHRFKFRIHDSIINLSNICNMFGRLLIKYKDLDYANCYIAENKIIITFKNE